MSSKNDEKNCGFAATQLVIGSIIGGAVGATAALLLAPKTGEEFRKDLQECGVLNKSLDIAKQLTGGIIGKDNEPYS